MKKLLCFAPLLLMFTGCGSAQIIGVGNRTLYPAVAQPVASPGTGTYGTAQTVTLTDATAGALICYTEDSSTPTGSAGACTGSSSTYSSPLTISATTVLKAIGTKAGWVNSSVLVSNYVISALGFTDNFPYSDGNLNSVSGGNWTNDSTASTQLYVSSNIVAGSTSNNCSGGATEPCFVRWTGSGGPAPANQSTQVTFTGISSAQLGPAVRVDTGGAKTGYALTCNYDVSFSAITCQLFKVVAGTGTLLENPGITVSSTATVKLTASGTSPTVLTAYVNGTTYTTYTDSSSPITSGTWGLAEYGNSGDTHISQAVGTTP